MLDSTRWVVHLPVSRDEEHPKAEEYGPDAVVVNVPGELLTKAYIPLPWGAATGRIAAIVGSTPATSAASELQTMRMARALALYVVGRLARPTTRTGFFWTTPTSSVDGGSCQLLKEFVKVTGMRESELNLGDLPLIATTNYHLDGLKPRSVSEEGTIDQSVIGWPVTLRLKVARAVRENSFEDQHVALGGSLKAMTPEKWKEHVRAGHYPARRDCLQCVMHGATGHRHTRVEHPSLFCLTVDITGPFRTQGEDPGARGDRAKAAKMKYLLVAKFTIPESYVTVEFEPTGSDPLDEEVGSKDLFDEEDKVLIGGDDRDPGEAIVEEEPLDAEEESEEADTGAGVGPIPLDVEAPKATYLLFSEPLLNDKGPTIASPIQSIVLYLQSLNIPVLRFHSDRAAQLTARPLVQWLHQQAIRTSTSTPGVPQGNGAAESAVKEFKLRTRKILSTSGLEKPFWPVAAKAVASIQRARVLRQVPKMIASFGSKVLVKKRRYAASGALIRSEFEERWSEGLYLGLSDQVADGHLVYVDGTFTHTKSVRDKAKLVDAGEHQPDEDQEMPVLEDGQDPPARRLRIHGKSAPRIAAIGGNPDDAGDSSGRGYSPDLEHREGGPKGRGHSPDYRDSSNDVEDERVVLAPCVAVRDGKLVLEHYDDDLPSDYEESSPRIAALEHNPDHEPDEDGDQEKTRDPEVYVCAISSQTGFEGRRVSGGTLIRAIARPEDLQED